MNLPLALQLYTLRTLSDDPRDLVKIAARAGYQAVEGVYTKTVDADSLNEVLAETGVEMVSAHVNLNVLETELNDVMRYQKTLGNTCFVIPWLGRDLYDRSAASWQVLGKRFGELAETCQGEGFRLLYHNHDFELFEVEGKLALDHLLEAAPALGLELDLGWCRRAQIDPEPLLERYAGRVIRIHVKDVAPAGENSVEDGWTDVGYGTVDWPPLLKAAQAAGTEWFVVEHDKPQEPVKTVERSRAFLEAL